MALKALNFFGPTINDEEIYNLPSRFEIDNTDDPPFGGFWLRDTSAGGGFGATIYPPSGAGSIDAVTWFTTYWRWNAMLASGQSGFIFDEIPTNGDSPRDVIRLRAVQAVGGFTLQILAQNLDVLGSAGTTVFQTSKTHFVVLRFDGQRIKLWVNGSLEITVDPASETPASAAFRTGGASAPGRKWACGAVLTAPSASDFDETTYRTEVRYHGPNEDSSAYDQYTGTSCDVLDSGDATYTNWYDWNCGLPHTGDTNFNCAPEGQAWKQSSKIQSRTYDFSVIAALVRTMATTTTYYKTVPHSLLMRHAVTDSIVAVGVLGLDLAYLPRQAIFDMAPGSVAWDEDKLNASEIGHARSIGGGSDIKVTAIGLEGLAVGPFV